MTAWNCDGICLLGFAPGSPPLPLYRKGAEEAGAEAAARTAHTMGKASSPGTFFAARAARRAQSSVTYEALQFLSPYLREASTLRDCARSHSMTHQVLG